MHNLEVKIENRTGHATNNALFLGVNHNSQNTLASAKLSYELNILFSWLASCLIIC